MFIRDHAPAMLHITIHETEQTLTVPLDHVGGSTTLITLHHRTAIYRNAKFAHEFLHELNDAKSITDPEAAKRAISALTNCTPHSPCLMTLYWRHR